MRARARDLDSNARIVWQLDLARLQKDPAAQRKSPFDLRWLSLSVYSTRVCRDEQVAIAIACLVPAASLACRRPTTASGFIKRLAGSEPPDDDDGVVERKMERQREGDRSIRPHVIEGWPHRGHLFPLGMRDPRTSYRACVQAAPIIDRAGDNNTLYIYV
jgi:hypothetical protein